MRRSKFDSDDYDDQDNVTIKSMLISVVKVCILLTVYYRKSYFKNENSRYLLDYGS